MTVRIGINGFGRMGRALYRASLERDLGIDVVAINELGALPTMAGLLARDSVYGRLGREVKPLVSSDIVGASASCVFDFGLTMVARQLVKVYGWYDNEWGYANRLGELAALVGAA
jgi:glyceraldehyde-3-phosphate dehydrogenase/erythrose-4-phosphate dehydrogenase